MFCIFEMRNNLKTMIFQQDIFINKPTREVQRETVYQLRFLNCFAALVGLLYFISCETIQTKRHALPKLQPKTLNYLTL